MLVTNVANRKQTDFWSNGECCKAWKEQLSTQLDDLIQIFNKIEIIVPDWEINSQVNSTCGDFCLREPWMFLFPWHYSQKYCKTHNNHLATPTALFFVLPDTVSIKKEDYDRVSNYSRRLTSMALVVFVSSAYWLCWSIIDTWDFKIHFKKIWKKRKPDHEMFLLHQTVHHWSSIWTQAIDCTPNWRKQKVYSKLKCLYRF